MNLLYYKHWTDKQKYFYVDNEAFKLFINFSIYAVFRHLNTILINSGVFIRKFKLEKEHLLKKMLRSL